MKIHLRNYQKEAIKSTRIAIANGVKKPLIVAPTASGKSVIIGGIIIAAIEKNPKNRILVLCFRGEILEQNEKTLLDLDPNINTGIYCSGLDRKDIDSQVVFASRDSLGRNPLACGQFDFIIVDEAHLVSKNNSKKKTNYQKIFDEMHTDLILGFTGTPWRLDNGNIWGKNGFFDKIAYNIPMGLLIDQGFLSRYFFPAKIETVIRTTGIRVSGGDFNISDLTAISSTNEIVKICIDKWEMIQQVYPRKCSIFFCCSIAHAKVVLSELQTRLVSVAYLDGATDKKERKQILQDSREGKYQAIVNVGVLTTGVDIKIIDCVVMLRATKSNSLFVQMFGRGLRILEGKSDCLMLDLTDNFERFGSIENPRTTPGKPVRIPVCSQCEAFRVPREPQCWQCKFVFMPGRGLPKYCPSCDSVCHAAETVCQFCSHIFISHSIDYVTDPRQKSGWFIVNKYTWEYSITRKGEKCVVVYFDLIGVKKPITQWLLYERDWAGNQRKQIEEMKMRKIELVKIDDRGSEFPNIKGVLYKENEPIEPFKTEAENEGREEFFS